MIFKRYKKDILNFLAKTKSELVRKYQYKPNTSCALSPDMSEEEREKQLWLHSEKMALAWVLISSDATTIIMHKNLRVCHDCHTTLKLMSKLYHKIIIVRDANRFHRFENGKCSCGDYW